ncbi:DDE-domain-containing protein, partial [Athelia psychrophila]
MSFSRPLESKRGRAVNPATNKAWFDLLGDTQQKYGLQPETTWAADESGFQASSGQRERVMGARKKEPQYQQRDGNQENITVIVTICGDGSALAPTMIFKGSAFQVAWKQDNPANATLGYSKKGWTDGEIGVEWIKDFDRQTQHTVEPGEYRCLLVDGHNSHYTRAFLQYARTHQILVLCYPAHTTHIYQGLDVVIFSVLKKCLSEERDRYERETREKISKKNFLTVYGRAHLRALTADNVKAAFRKTGVWPYDRAVVTAEMMAPSKETSCEGSLPVVPPTPVR